MPRDARSRFAEIAAREDSAIDPCEGALVIALEHYPALSLDAERARIEALAEAARPGVAATASAHDRVAALNRFLFEEQGFAGNRDEYYDARNSFLNEVLDRRTGIPITLSILYCEVARQLGLQARGVSFPGHFLVRIENDTPGAEPLVVDAFSAQMLDRAGCTDLLRHFLGPGAELSPANLQAANPRQVLFRLLSNLKHLYLQARNFEQVLSCSDRILMLEPDAPLELRDRGLVFHQLECAGPALSDLERFLELSPDHESAERVRELAAELRTQQPAVH